MSRIDKLSIQGIRSFGPSDTDKGLIQFCTPLTLILGPNGTGKTTIIECLKYMTTGEFPAGARINGAFINDPKIAGETEVRAQVRMQFCDLQGSRCVAQRSLAAIQKQTKVEMKTLEGLIQKRGTDGTTVQLSSRCAETDKEMISLLGVSKPILENVIFCHQEESNWPLSEGKALKQKFDDIFASTRYVKALDVIRKCHKEKTGLIKEYNAELPYLRENKDRCEQVNKRLEELNSRRQVSVEGMSQAEEQLKPLVEKLNALESQEESIRQISNVIAKLEGERAQVKELIENLERNINTPFHGTMQELEEEIKGFKNKLAMKERELKENEDRQTTIEKELKEQQRYRSRADTEQALLQQEAERNMNRTGVRNKKLDSLAKQFLPADSLLGAGDVSKRDAHVIMTSLQQLLNDLNGQLKNKKDEHTREVGRLQKEMDGRRDERMRLETEKTLKENTLRSKGEEVRLMEGRLQKMDQSVGRLQELKEEMAAVETKLTTLKSSHSVEDLRREVVGLQDERGKHDASIRVLDDELRLLHEDTATRTQLQVYSKERCSKEANIKRILAKNEDSLRHIMGQIPSHDLKKRLDDYIREQSRRVRQGQEALSSLKHNLTQLTTTHKIEKERLERKEKEAKGYEERLAEVTGGEDLTQGLTNLADKLQAHQDNRGNLTAIDYMFTNYISKLHRTKPDCPLCHRPFDEQSEVDELVSEMEEKLRMVPEKLERVQEAIVETNKLYDAWIQLRPIKEALNACKDEDIPKIEENLQRLSKEMADLSSKVAEKEEELEADSNDESVAKGMTSDATIVDKLLLDIKDLDNKITLHSNNLRNDTIDKTVDEVQREKTAQMTMLDALVGRLEERQGEMERVSRQLHQHQQRLHDLRSERSKIEEDLRERIQLEEGVKELKEGNQVLCVQVAKAKEDLQPIMQQIEALADRQRQLGVAYEGERSRNEAEISNLSSQMSHLKSLQNEIDEFERNAMEAKLKESGRRLRSLDESVVELEGERGRLVGVVDSLRSELALHKGQERDLEDSRLLMEKKREVGVMEERMSQERSKLGGCDISNLQKEKNEMRNQADVHVKKLEALRIRKTHAEGEISSLRTELASASLKDAFNKHKEMVIKIKTTEIVCGDLDKYYKALEKAIMSYHVSKMSELNKIIKELWMNTYKGQDIESIEIRSDEDDESGASKARRIYKYRVVMVRAGVEMNMRGRCSAGQKVLASLIIRLALAETFCLNFGMLALDEPTTNLDRENIESLAGALTEIIKSRSKQRNFQMIVITHDEDFVELLGRSEYVEYFYRLSKDAVSGNSMVTKTGIQELQTK